MIIIIIQGFIIERNIRNYIEKSSLELISFMEYTIFVIIKIIFFNENFEYLDNKLFFKNN
jgi:hypothetical protein